MNKTPEPGEVARDKVIAAAEELVVAVTERVVPLAKEAVEQVSPVAVAAAGTTAALLHAAAEKVAPLTHQAVDAVTPLAQQTREAITPYARQAADAVGPYAHQAADMVGPYAHQAAEKIGPLALHAAEAVAPYAVLVREQGLKAGHDLADRLEPAYEAAKEVLSGARDKVSTEVLPAVGAVASTAAASATPLVAAAADRGKALVKSARGESAVVVAPPKKKRRWIRTVAVVAAAAGATYIVVRKLVGDRGSQWQTARPTTPYAPPTVSAEAGVAKPTDADREAEGRDEEVVASTTSLYGVAGTGEQAEASAHRAGDPGPSEDTDADAVADRVEQVQEVAAVDEGDDPSSATASGSSSHTSRPSEHDTSGEGATYAYSDEKLQTELETVEEQAYEEPEDAVKVEEDPDAGLGPDAHPERYLDIPGAYVGVEPPDGYEIKGNERSMKYHLPDSNSYARTIAQVWFSSEAAAEQAGFSKAEH